MQTRRSFLRRTAGLAALALFGTALLPLPASAAPPSNEQASAFVQKLGDQAVAVLVDPNVTAEQSIGTFRILLMQNFDLTTIGRFVLGQYWNRATPEQREEYQRLFEEMIVQIYAERFDQYGGERFSVSGARPEGDRDAIVTSEVVPPSGPVVKVDWRVRNRDSGLKIIDVIVENTSLSVTQRAEFRSVIEGNGGRIEALLDAIRERIQTVKAE